MRVLLIGNPESIWTKEFIDKVLLPIGASVSLQCDPDADGRFDDCYRDSGVRIIGQYRLSPLIMKIPKIRVLHRQFRKKAALAAHKGEFDAVIVLYVTPFALKCARSLAKADTKRYAVFIGSDILRSSQKNTASMRRLLKDNRTSVICESCQTEAAFYDRIGRATAVPAKVIYFGDTPFRYIDDQLESGINKCKKQYGIPEDKISVCIGYNASPAQQHLKVIEQIGKLTDKIRKKIFLVVPAAYGGDAAYIAELDAAMKSTGTGYCVLTKFLCPNDVAALRVATDIFINAQTTDSISASVMEAYYAGARLLNAGWLKYREFSNWDLEYDVFESFEDICPLVEKNIGNLGERSNANRGTVLRNWSWNTCKDRWNDVLNKGETEND